MVFGDGGECADGGNLGAGPVGALCDAVEDEVYPVFPVVCGGDVVE